MLKRLLLFSLSIYILGCSKMEDIPQNTLDLRTEIIKEKTDSEIKDLFFSLTFENQKEL